MVKILKNQMQVLFQVQKLLEFDEIKLELERKYFNDVAKLAKKIR